MNKMSSYDRVTVDGRPGTVVSVHDDGTIGVHVPGYGADDSPITVNADRVVFVRHATYEEIPQSCPTASDACGGYYYPPDVECYGCASWGH